MIPSTHCMKCAILFIATIKLNRFMKNYSIKCTLMLFIIVCKAAGYYVIICHKLYCYKYIIPDYLAKYSRTLKLLICIINYY